MKTLDPPTWDGIACPNLSTQEEKTPHGRLRDAGSSPSKYGGDGTI